MSRVIVRLTPTALLRAAQMAGLIQTYQQANALAGAVQNRRVAELGDLEINFVGRLGEEASSQHLDIPLRRDILEFGDDGCDLIVNGQRTQVKTNHRRYDVVMPYLESMDKLKANWLIWCGLYAPATVCIYGFISREKFQRRCFDHTFGYGPLLCVREEDLTDISRIIEATTTKEIA